MAMEIFKLIGSIFVDSEQADKSLSKTDEKAKGIGSTLASGVKTAGKWAVGIGAAAAAAGTAIFKVASDSAAASDEIDKMSQRLGVSREAYQELDFVLSQSGVDVNSFSTGMKSLLANMDKVTEGNKTAIENFKTLGVVVEDANGNMLDQETVLWRTIKAFQGMEDSSEKSRLAQELFGKQGQEILPLLNSEAGSLEAMKQQAHDLGLVLEDDTIDAGVNFTDMIDQVKRSMSSVMTQVGAEVMPLITEAMSYIIDHMPEIKATVSTVIGTIGELIEKLMPVIKKAFEFAGVLWETTLKPMLDGIITFLDGVFSGNWAQVWQGIKDTFAAAFNGLKTIFAEPINWIIEKLNSFIDSINKIQIPEWVPGVGGKGLNIPKIPYIDGGSSASVSSSSSGYASFLATSKAQQSGDKETQNLLKQMNKNIENLANTGIYLDGDKMVGGLSGRMDESLGKSAGAAKRGALA